MYKRLFVLGLIYLVWGWSMTIPDNKVKVVFCNVGQGDGALITSGYFQMLIDTGPTKGNIEKCLDDNLPLGDKKLEVVMLSHWDSDHSGALENLEKSYKIDKVIAGMGIVGSEKQAKIKADKVAAGDVVLGNNFKFEVIYPDAGLEPRSNDSIVGVLKYPTTASQSDGQVNILFTGDIDELVEKSILDRLSGPIDMVKLSHHGSATGNSDEWLKKINANFAIVSVGKNNYGHPNAEVLGRVLGLGTTLLRTDINGTMVVE